MAKYVQRMDESIIINIYFAYHYDVNITYTQFISSFASPHFNKFPGKGQQRPTAAQPYHNLLIGTQHVLSTLTSPFPWGVESPFAEAVGMGTVGNSPTAPTRLLGPLDSLHAGNGVDVNSLSCVCDRYSISFPLMFRCLK